MEGMKLGETGMWRWIWEALRVLGEYKQNTLYSQSISKISYYNYLLHDAAS